VKKYRGFGIILLCVAGIFVLFALISWGLDRGDLFAEVEYRLPRRRNRGEANFVAFPAFVVIKASLSYALAIALSGVAHIRGSLRMLVVSAVVGVVAGLWAAIDGALYGRDSSSTVFAVLFALAAIGISLYAAIKTARDSRRSPGGVPAVATGMTPGPAAPLGAHGPLEWRYPSSMPQGPAYQGPAYQGHQAPYAQVGMAYPPRQPACSPSYPPHGNTPPQRGGHALPAQFSGWAGAGPGTG